jgi:hypothetical protein
VLLKVERRFCAVSKSKEIGSQASVLTAQSCIRTPICVYCSSLHLSERLSNGHSSEFQEESSIQVHPSGQRGNIIRKPVSVWQVKGFPLQTKIWEDSCNHPDDKSTLSRSKTWRIIATVWTSGQHRPDANPYYENCMQLKCNYPDARATPSGRGLIQERKSMLSGKLVAQLSVWTAIACVRKPPTEIWIRVDLLEQ